MTQEKIICGETVIITKEEMHGSKFFDIRTNDGKKFMVYSNSEITVSYQNNDNAVYCVIVISGKPVLMHQKRFEQGRPFLRELAEELAQELRRLASDLGKEERANALTAGR